MNWRKRIRILWRGRCEVEGCEEPQWGILWTKCQRHVNEDFERAERERKAEEREEKVSMMQEAFERALGKR